MYQAKRFPSKSARYIMHVLKMHAQNGIVRGMSVERIARAADVNVRHCRVMLRDIERNGFIKTTYNVGAASDYRIKF